MKKFQSKDDLERTDADVSVINKVKEGAFNNQIGYVKYLN